jgi:hypothetical protein
MDIQSYVSRFSISFNLKTFKNYIYEKKLMNLESLRISDEPKRKAAIEKATKEHNEHLKQVQINDKG